MNRKYKGVHLRFLKLDHLIVRKNRETFILKKRVYFISLRAAYMIKFYFLVRCIYEQDFRLKKL